MGETTYSIANSDETNSSTVELSSNDPTEDFFEEDYRSEDETLSYLEVLLLS